MNTKPQIKCRYLQLTLPVTFFTILLCIFSNTATAVEFIQLEREFSGKGSSEGTFSKDIHLAFKTNIYVSDTENRLIQKLSPTGAFLLQIPTNPESPDNILRKPGHLTVDDLGNIYVADVTTHHIADTSDPKIYVFAPCVHKLSPTSELLHTYFVDTVDERPGVVLPAKVIIDENGKPALAIQPTGHDRALRVAVNAENHLYVLDAKRGRIHKFDTEGKKTLTFGRYGAGNGEFDKDAADIAVDARDNVFVADTGNHRIVKFSGDGKFVLSFGKRGRNKNEFVKPMTLVTLSRYR